MIKSLPQNIRRVFEKHGIEADALSFDDASLVVAFDDLEVAFKVREAILDLHACCLISKNNKPHLLIHNLRANQ